MDNSRFLSGFNQVWTSYKMVVIVTIMDIIQEIRKKSREEWIAEYLKWFQVARVWLQDNGEKALIAGVVVGILVTLAFSFVLFLSIVAALLMFAVWYTAKPSP